MTQEKHLLFRANNVRKSTSLSRVSLSSKYQDTSQQFKKAFFRHPQNRDSAKSQDNADPNTVMQRVEAVLLISKEPTNTRHIAKLANLADGTEARTVITQINRKYAEFGRAFRIEKIAGGYQLMTHQELAPWIRRLHGFNRETKLSDPALETLSIVAYRQPILRADIEQIRGVSCGEVLRQLMDRKYVKISGRSEELGRPFLYTTTKYFLKYFGLDKLEDLPKTEYFRTTTDNPFPSSLEATAETLEDYG
ncbi:MAG: SMC-Scp complex subunit ScpB [Planctomycetota bacterium]|nr:SMC-Scp complex subunit ScpB [Planctomycetota bacterium]